MGYLSERPETWKTWWLVMWATIAAALVVGAFLLPFRQWFWAATAMFGGPELAAIVDRTDEYPPLTHVIRYFLPKWTAFTLIFAAYGTIGSFWFGFHAPLRFGALFGLLGWLIAHFDTVYSE